MDQSADRLEGKCRCGRLRFQITAQPLMTVACHCTGCQRMSSSAFALTAIIPADGFSVVQGEPVRGGLQEGGGGHYFCGFCKTWVFTRPDDGPVVNVRPTMFEHAEWSRPYIEVFTSEKLAWATTPAVHSYERFPAMSEFPSLMKEFAGRVAADTL